MNNQKIKVYAFNEAEHRDMLDALKVRLEDLEKTKRAINEDAFKNSPFTLPTAAQQKTLQQIEDARLNVQVLIMRFEH